MLWDTRRISSLTPAWAPPTHGLCSVTEAPAWETAAMVQLTTPLEELINTSITI